MSLMNFPTLIYVIPVILGVIGLLSFTSSGFIDYYGGFLGLGCIFTAVAVLLHLWHRDRVERFHQRLKCLQKVILCKANMEQDPLLKAEKLEISVNFDALYAICSNLEDYGITNSKEVYDFWQSNAMKLVITDDIQIWSPVGVAFVTMIDSLSSTINEKIGSRQSLSAFKQQATTVRRRNSLFANMPGT